MSPHSRPNFGNDDQVVAWQRECNVLALKMTSDYAVAPQCHVTRADGRVLGPGEAVTVDDFEPLDGIHPAKLLERAVRDGAVLVRGQRYPIQGGNTAA